MTIVCPGCGFSREAPDRLPKGTMRVTCPACALTFLLPATLRRKAGFLVRAVALVVDMLIINVLSFFLALVSDEALTLLLRKTGLADPDTMKLVVGGTVFLLCSILGFAYFIIADVRFGRTAGKALMGIRVMRRSGRKLTWSEAIAREVGGKIISGLPAGLGFLWAIVDRDRQAVHDKIAGSYVVCD